MRLTPDTLARHLAKDDSGKDELDVWLVFGAEPLLVEESCDAIRKAARSAGFEERLRYTIDRDFDWNIIRELSVAQSLFATRRIVEIRLPATRVGDAVNELSELLGNPPADTKILLIGSKIDKKTRSTKWFKSVEQLATLVDCPEVQPKQMISWLTARLKQAGLNCEEGVVERMAWFLEGNLLAAAQEIERLKLVNDGNSLTLEVVDASLSDHARFSVYGWVDALLGGRIARGLRILDGLKREGTEPFFALLMLAREVRVIAAISTDMAGGMTEGQAIKKANVWASRQALTRHALKRFPAPGWQQVLTEIAYADRILKGRGTCPAGIDNWDELERLSLRICAADIDNGANATPMAGIRRAMTG